MRNWISIVLVLSIALTVGIIFSFLNYQPEEFCGDGVCQVNESCNICEIDCGICEIETEAEVVVEVEEPIIEEPIAPAVIPTEAPKEWDNINYQHDYRAENYRVVCKQNCRIAKPAVERTFKDVGTTYEFLKEITQTDIHSDLLPFEYHVSSDDTCKFTRRSGFDQIAYAQGFTDADGTYRGLICYDQDQYNINDAVLTHEVTHLFQFRRFPTGGNNEALITEGFADIVGSLSLFNNQVKSFCWDGNNIDGKFSSFPAGIGYPAGRQLYFELCDQHGFDVDDLPALFAELNKMKPVNAQAFVAIINTVVGEDTTQTFFNNGVIF